MENQNIFGFCKQYGKKQIDERISFCFFGDLTNDFFRNQTNHVYHMMVNLTPM